MSRASEYAGEDASPQFVEWLEAVDGEVEALCGISVFNLPDVDFYMFFDAEDSPESTAINILTDEGFPFDE